MATFWKSYLLALQRVAVDVRSRSFVLKTTLLLLYLVIFVILYGFVIPFWSAEGPVSYYAFYGFIAGTGMIAFFLLRRHHARENESLNFSLTKGTAPPAKSGQAEESSAVRRYLSERAVIISSLVSRAGAEIRRSCNQNPANNEGMIRQIQNGLLRQQRLWMRLQRTEAELMSGPEGTWTDDQQNRIVIWCEQLRLLRWALRVDADLTPLSHFPRIDIDLATNLSYLLSPGESCRPMLAPFDVRVERDIALAYAARAVAELKVRNLIEMSPDLEVWADQLREAFLGPSTDYLAGAKTIEELSDGELMLIANTAVARERYATYLVEQLSCESTVAFDEWSLRGPGF